MFLREVGWFIRFLGWVSQDLGGNAIAGMAKTFIS
jgi:hypothetical protein